MGATDRYCLRWNNHQANLISVMDELLSNQTLTDVTLGVEDGRFLKCHKIILATCSPYFRTLFLEVPSSHPIILLKDVRYAEVKAILEFMYKGEVSIAYGDLDALFRVAELLQVKGLVTDNDVSSDDDTAEPRSPNVGSTSGNINDETRPQNPESGPANSSRSQSAGQPFSATARLPSQRQDLPEPTIPAPAWPLPSHLFPTDEQRSAIAALANFNPFLPAQSFAFSQFCENLARSSGAGVAAGNAVPNDLTTHQRPDASILRAVLNPEQEDDSPGTSPTNRQDPRGSNRPNGSTGKDDGRGSADLSLSRGATASPPREHDESSIVDDGDGRANPLSYTDDTKYGVGNYGTVQKQGTGKRYKKYSRKDIWDAIAAVQGGLSANKAAELFSVPSRTLYDKIKKLGIPPTKHRRNESVGNSSGSQYDIVGHPSNVSSEDIAKNTSEERNETIEHSGSVAMIPYGEIRDEPTDPEDLVDARRKSLPAYPENSQSTSCVDARLKEDEDEAEDLTVNRRSNVRVIISPKKSIPETV